MVPRRRSSRTCSMRRRSRMRSLALVLIQALLSTPPLASSSSTTTDFKCFKSTEELYAAVDAVLWSMQRAEEEENKNLTSTSLSSADAAFSIYGPSMEDWCVARLTNFSHVFSSLRNTAAALYFRDISLGSWDISGATDLSYMFHGTVFFNGQDLDLWDTSNVRFMDGMFQKNEVGDFTGDLTFWDVSNVESTNSMFAGSKIPFNETQNDIRRWNVQSLRSAASMFDSLIPFQYNLCDWGTKMVSTANTTNMFKSTSCFYRHQSTADPNLSQAIPGPFCYVCDKNEVSINSVQSGAAASTTTTKPHHLWSVLSSIMTILLLGRHR